MKLIKNYNEENLFKTKFTGSGIAILILLVMTILGLGERILYDLARALVNPIGDFGYFNNPKVIIIHAVFVILLLIVSILITYIFGRKKEKYALILVPYFLTSVLLAIQLSLQLGVYFTNYHSSLQFYLVMILLVMVSSYGIFHIQNNYKKESNTLKTNNIGLLVVCVAVFALFSVLILSFNNKGDILQEDDYSSVQDILTPENNYEVAPSLDIPKIAFWMGAVNQHWDITNNKWVVDPQPTGANVDRLMYCKKWYPNTKRIEATFDEILPVYYTGSYEERGPYTAKIYKCVD